MIKCVFPISLFALVLDWIHIVHIDASLCSQGQFIATPPTPGKLVSVQVPLRLIGARYDKKNRAPLRLKC